MQKRTREQDAIALCKELFDFVCGEFDECNCNKNVCSIRENFKRVMSGSDYEKSGDDILLELDAQNKRLGSEYSIRIPSSASSSHGWKLSQSDNSKTSFNSSKDALISLIENLKTL